jgi:nicotinamidase/pyrazinamidase
MASDTVLIVVDVQNDFCPGGALAVECGDEIVPHINQLIRSFDHVVLTQDWHPPDHSSFASQHEGRQPFETIDFLYGSQTLWPDHCVQGSKGAEFHPRLEWRKAELILRKGFRRPVDSYSAFFENDRRTPTGLSGYLRERSIAHVVLAGLATDYCVGFSALDARKLGFSATVIESACRAIDLQGSLSRMKDALAGAGVRVET